MRTSWSFLLVLLCNGNAVLGFSFPTVSSTFKSVKSFNMITELAPTKSDLISSLNPIKTVLAIRSPRIQRIKEVNFQRELLKDITAAEFALRVEVRTNSTTIDYNKLILKLDLAQELLSKRELPLGSKEKLSSRIQNIKEDLLLVADNQPPKHYSDYATTEELASTETIQLSQQDQSVANAVMKAKNPLDLPAKLRILVREDGTVDWDGAIASGREVARFGTELWERLNGKEENEGMPSFNEFFTPAEAKPPLNDEILRLTEIYNQTKLQISEVSNQLEQLRALLRNQRKGGQGFPGDDLLKLRNLDLSTKELNKRLKIISLNLDMEKICAYLQQELEGATVDPAADQKILIAEVALLDRQLTALMSGLQLSYLTFPVDSEENWELRKQKEDETWSELLSIVDDDELDLISNEVQDLKIRLGVDTKQVGPTFDWGSLGKVVSETLTKIKAGFAFFSDGTKLLVADVQYALELIRKAAFGYTLKPREVNTIRRTGKDLLTLIPFTIILIIPLTPVGHVLAFSFIQRFFPEFYPSFYTERRLNLKKLFSEVEFKREEDLIDIEDKSNRNLVSKLSDVVSWVGSIFALPVATPTEGKK